MSGSDSPPILGGSSFGRTRLPPLASDEAFSPFRLRPASVSGFPLSWLNNRLPCARSFLSCVSAVESVGPPKFLTLSLRAYHTLRLTLADPRGSHTHEPSSLASDSHIIVSTRFNY